MRKIANIETTIRCNLNCKMCTQKELREKVKAEDMSFEIFKEILYKYPDIAHVSFVGGEPFVNKDFYKMMSFLDKKDISYEITTNGTLIDKETINKIKQLKKLVQINFSIDGFKNYHDRERGKGVFDKCIKAIFSLKKHFPIFISTLIKRGNIKQIPLLIKYFEKMGIRNFRLIYPTYIYQKWRKEALKIFPYLKIQGPIVKDLPSQSDVINLFQLIKSSKNSCYFIFEPYFLNDSPYLFFNLETINYAKCKQMEQYRFDCSGRRIMCEFLRNEYDPYLHRYLSQKLLPICRVCCKLDLKKDAIVSLLKNSRKNV